MLDTEIDCDYYFIGKQRENYTMIFYGVAGVIAV